MGLKIVPDPVGHIGGGSGFSSMGGGSSPALFDPVDADSLQTGIIEYWALNENATTRTGGVAGSTIAPATNGPSRAVGKIGYGGTFVAASSQRLYNASLAITQMADYDWSMLTWVKLASRPAYGIIVARWHNSTNNREYELGYQGGATDRLFFWVSYNGAAQYSVQATRLGSPATDRWYMLYAWHDSVNNAIGIRVDDDLIGETFTPAAAGTFAGDSEFNVGSSQGGAFYFDGQVGGVGLWRRLLTRKELVHLWNGGAGRQYPFNNTAEGLKL